MRGRLVTVIALPIGLALLAVAIARADLRSLASMTWQLGLALPVVLVPGALWHLARTVAWQQCFPAELRPPFWRLFRVRLAAEAFSFVTVRGVGGEPLKVVLLKPLVPTETSTAAVALERIAYVVVTCSIVFVAAILALAYLPLTRAWIRVFAGVAGVSAAASLALILLVTRPPRGQARRRSAESSPDGRPRHVARFVRAVDVQLRALVRGDRRRLAVVALLEVFAYFMMGLEVWAALRAAHVAPSLLGAMAIETFTRVASMASAFIPGNLGALEASNVVAAGMIDAAAGAAALALVRRVRGLLWCAAGFACYPPRAFGGSATDSNVRPEGTLAIYEDERAHVRISAPLGGLPIGERTIRAAARAGFADVVVWAPKQHREWRRIASRVAGAIEVSVFAHETEWQEHAAGRRAVVISSSVVPTPAGLREARAVSLNETLPPNNQAWNTPDALSITTIEDLRIAERQLRASIVKATDGVVGRFNRRMSIPISVALIRSTRCSANAMTVLLIALGVYAGWLLSHGSYAMGVLGAAVSLAASILDGCDGELARLQYQESAFGVWLDTLGDYTYYLAVFAGLTLGAVRQTGWSGFWWIGAALVAGCLATFALLILLRRRITRGQPERLRSATQSHFERRGTRWTALVARLSTVATRATMPYGILAFALANALPGLVVLAAVGANVYWISLSLELSRLLAGGAERLPPAPTTAIS